MREIRAEIDANAIKRVNAFFNSSMRDTLREVFQNCRRSGATAIRVAVCGDRIQVQDNGAGIADPAVLLAFGKSEWEGLEDEAPAGMGLYALANTESTITSRQAGQESGWQVHLKPAHFTGERSALVESVDGETPVGTRISFRKRGWQLKELKEVARYLPLHVYLHGVRVEQQEFDKGSDVVGVEHHDDVSFVIRQQYDRENTSRSYARQTTVRRRWKTRVNFHGHVIEDKLNMPCVHGINRVWFAEIDGHACHELKLVLPARKEVVRNAYLERLRERAEEAIYRTLQALDDPADLPFNSWQRGSAVLDEPVRHGAMKLEPWTRRTDENRDRTENEQGRARVEPTKGAILMIQGTAGPAQVLMEQARKHNPGMPALYKEDPRLEGYPEYDALRYLVNVGVRTTELDREHAPAENTASDGHARRVEAIELVCTLRDQKWTRTEELLLASRIGFSAASSSYGIEPSEIGLCVTAEDQPASYELNDWVMQAFFSPDENGIETESTQRERFAEQVEIEVERLFVTEDELLRQQTRKTLDAEVVGVVRSRGPIVIDYTVGGTCRVKNAPASGS